jgi:hypothetical protein
MARTTLGLAVVSVLLAATGCRMCCHPYDYSGPVYQDQGCSSCRSQPRAGSILDGSVAGEPAVSRSVADSSTASRPVASRSVVSRPTATATSRPTSMPVPSQVSDQTHEGLVPGSERLISVTDRVVDPSGASTSPSSAVADSSADSPQLLPSRGWTARRATSDMFR